jgi:Ca-activated chloride channel family protein
MSFAWPWLLLLLPLIPAGVGLLLVLDGRRVRSAAQFGHLRLGAAATAPFAALRRRIVAAFFLAGLATLVLAMARPQSVVSLPVSEGTVILAFDVSGSMSATDLKPTRLEAAKAAARDFVDRQPDSVVIGVVAFSESGFAVQAPTNNTDTVLAAINRLTPQRGTSVGRGIVDSLQAIAKSREDPAKGFYTNRSPDPSAEPTPLPAGAFKSASIVLLTDGENNERPEPLAAAKLAADLGVRIYPIGIGSPEGATITIEGFTVRSRLDPELLGQIAALTGGKYFAADSGDTLQAIYDEIDPELTLKPQTTELTAIVGGLGLLLVLVGGLSSLAWTGRLP